MVKMHDRELGLLEEIANLSFQEISNRYGIELKKSKSVSHNFINAYLKSRVPIELIAIESPRLKIKTVGKSLKTGKCFESVSLRNVNFYNLSTTDFWNSELFKEIDSLVFLPIIKSSRDSDVKDWIVGSCRTLALDHEIIYRISEEYSLYREFTVKLMRIFEKKGKFEMKRFWEDNFPRSSETSIIHMRPHAKNRKDYDLSIEGFEITKHSFWFNKVFLNEFLLKI